MDIKVEGLKIYQIVDKIDKHWCWNVRNQTSSNIVKSVFKEIDFENKGYLLVQDIVR